ncbi:hypothetical protein AM587_10008854 [Phytophthora nicotianae]|uniref:Jacalin-type lectin domain-containing protein n=1 Tax=Phytophthora nicotianae TaxID=4792 RepID=A0A0W8DYH8_PHYNI|nr:hypothetical protein AM587_10008854 [Phytophthora nicotianae]
MHVLHLILAIVVALISINNGVAIAAKTVLRSESNDYPALRDSIANAYRPVAGGHGGYAENGWGEFVPLPPGTYEGPEFGGPHGDPFTDAALIKSGQKVLSINLRAGERVDAVILTIVKPFGGERTLYHGGDGGDMKNPLTLTEGEYITVMEAHAGDHDGSTRVKYIKFTTNKGNFIEGGTRTDKNGTDTAKEGYQLGGFVGRSGDELDLVSAIWTSIQPVG